MILTAIYDLKTNEFFNFYFVKNVNDALRIYMSSFITEEKSPLTNFPHDFDLYQLGIIDAGTGQFEEDKKLINHFTELKDMANHDNNKD